MIALFFLFLLLSSCSMNNIPSYDTAARGEVVGYEYITTVTPEQISRATKDSVPDSLLHYAVNAYRMTYGTIQENEPVVTTALVLVPQGVTDMQYVAYLHGTILPIEAFGSTLNMPSNYNFSAFSGGTEVLTFGLPFASNGRTVIMPDYIGFGETANKEHVFIYYPELRYQTIDALRAFKTHEHIQGIMPLLIAGWSQGGGAALSLQYYLQRDYSSEFYVRSTSALAGLYHFSGIMPYVNSNTTDIVPPIMLCTWAAYCVNRFCLHRPNDLIFTNPVNNQVEACLGPIGGLWDVFRPAFLTGALNGTDTEWVKAAEGNDYYQGWCPTGKVFLHHGTRDMLVPYQNSVDAHEGLTAAGGDVTFYTYEGGGHGTHTYTFMKQTINDWRSLP